MRLFDAYIAVDWSSRNEPSPERPTRDAIWIGEVFTGNGNDANVVTDSYWTTRRLAEGHIRARLEAHRKAERRVFLGFDFPYGYPAGFAEALNLAGEKPAWRLIWEEFAYLVRDSADNESNRFDVADELNARCGRPTPGPFWGHPTGREYLTLKSKRRGNHQYPYEVGPHLRLDEKRWSERYEPKAQSVWELCYKGSVGSQSIVGIPVVRRLRDDPTLASFSQVWPFETGFTMHPTPEKGPFILHAEIWPGVRLFNTNATDLPDREQVRAVVSRLAEFDDKGRLGVLFDTPPNLPPGALSDCVAEEGWILGSGQSTV